MAVTLDSSPFGASTSKRFGAGDRQTGKIRSLAWNNDGKRLASGGANRSLRIWSPEKDNKTSSQMVGHSAEVSSIRWDPTHPEHLASCSAATGTSVDKGVYFWDIRQGKPTAVVPTSGENIWMTWSPSGETVVVSNRSDQVTHIDVRTHAVTRAARSAHECNEAVFVHDGALLLTALDGTVQVARWPGMEEVHRVAVSPVATIALDLDPRGRFLAAGSNDATVSLWETGEFTCVRSVGHHDDPLRTCRFSHDGQFLATSVGDGTGIVISEVPTLEKVQTVPVSGRADALAWHPTRRVLAYASDEADGARGAAGGFRVIGL